MTQTTVLISWRVHVNRTHSYVHRRSHPMGPVGRVPPTLKDVGTKSIWSPQLLQLAVFFRWDLAYSNGRPRRPDNVFSCIVVSELILETQLVCCVWLLHSLKHEQHASSYS